MISTYCSPVLACGIKRTDRAAHSLLRNIAFLLPISSGIFHYYFSGHFVLRSLTTLPHDLGGGMSFYGLQQYFCDFRRFAEAPRAALCSLIRQNVRI
ncbi:hypothetical protein [Paenibacillus polymyxa]|uniref:hypothetical protein n=1 Tax=Paenibacillus polymyxa TaxID=1406 RepID=UPI0025B6A368|nr:hypothetical protein [Paenibacillus polymyxa]